MNSNCQNSNGSRTSIDRLCHGAQGETQEQRNRMDRIQKQGEDLLEKNPTGVDRFFLTAANKKLYDIVSNKRAEAAEITLTNQNMALELVSRGQLAMVGETVNTMVETGRAILQTTAATIVRENHLALGHTLMETTKEVSNLIEDQIQSAQGRPALTQNLMADEIELLSKEWADIGKHIQRDFSRIKTERIVF